MSKTLGRLSAAQMKHVEFDAPEATVQAILTKQDEIIAKLNVILAAVEVAVDAASLFTALDVAGTKAQLSTIDLKI